jgi:nucleoside-diphosphate-sugar epimerase
MALSLSETMRLKTLQGAGTPREGQRRIMITGAHRKVAVELISMLLADARVDKIFAISEGACPPALLGHDPERFKFATARLNHRREVDNLFLLDDSRHAPLDTVVHLAFAGNPRGYTFERHEFNVNSARHLLDASLRHGIGKYVFLSSDAVYRVGARVDYKVREDSELNLDPDAHATVRDIIDAEFICRAKMDQHGCDVMVLRPAGVIGGGVMSGLNLLCESHPPLLPVGFDPMINPTTKERLARDLWLAIMLKGKGVYNLAGAGAGPLASFLEERGITPKRVPGALLRPINRFQRYLGQTRYHAEFHPKRLYYSLVLDDGRFQALFRDNAALLELDDGEDADETLEDETLKDDFEPADD